MLLSEINSDKKYTYADYLTWSEEIRVELIAGKVSEMSPAPYSIHQIISGNIFAALFLFCKSKNYKVLVAPFDVRFPEKGTEDHNITTVVQPDICVICDKNKIDVRGCLGSPDLIVEIVSKSTQKKDLNDKFNLYESTGVKEYWIVFPAEKYLSIYYLKDGFYNLKNNFEIGQQLTSHIFPDFKMEVEEVFAF